MECDECDDTSFRGEQKHQQQQQKIVSFAQ